MAGRWRPWTHGVTGWRVPPGDPVALAAALDHVLGMRAGGTGGAGCCGAGGGAGALHRARDAGRDDRGVSRGAAARPGRVRDILVIRHGALGDFVLSFPAFAAIRARHRGARITLQTTAPFAALARAAPWFDAVVVDPRPSWWNLPGLVAVRRQLRGHDFVYDLQTSGRSTRYFRLAGRPPWSGIAPGLFASACQSACAT